MNDCRFGVSPVNYPDPDPVNTNFLLSYHICDWRYDITTVQLFTENSSLVRELLHMFTFGIRNFIASVVISERHLLPVHYIFMSLFILRNEISNIC